MCTIPLLGRLRGAAGGYGKLTRDVFAIGLQMVRENPVPPNIAALAWMARYMQSCSRRSVAPRIAEVTI